MRLSDFHFDLPADRIAQAPMVPRDASRLLVHDRASGRTSDAVFRDLPDFLRAGDLLVLNDTRVVPWRLVGRRATGGRVDCLIVARAGARAEGFVRPGKRLAAGEVLTMEEGALSLRLTADLGGGRFAFAIEARDSDVDAILEARGRAPLPPYVERADEDEATRRADRERYQTVFARQAGAIAAPTAGLHFTLALLDRIAALGVAVTHVTLHVGLGTFEPIRVEAVEEHRMHAERFVVPTAAADAVAAARARGGRVIAVGTTAARVLETVATSRRDVPPCEGSTALFVTPGFRFQVVDALVTNFHLPGSTLLLMLAAFVGREPLLELYRRAIDSGYRFYSFGDAMLVT